MLYRTSAIAALVVALSAGTAFAGEGYGSRGGSNQNAFAKADNYSFNWRTPTSTTLRP